MGEIMSLPLEERREWVKKQREIIARIKAKNAKLFSAEDVYENLKNGVC